MKVEEITVVIPAAGRVPEGLLALSNISCPAMIPIGGRPVIHWTMSYLRSLGLTKFVIAVSRRGMFVEDFVACAFGETCDVRFIASDRGVGLGGTILDLCGEVTTRGMLVVLGDTHFSFVNPKALQGESPVVLTSRVDESYRWCIAETDKDEILVRLRDKEHGLSAPLDALIGVYFLPDASAVQRAAEEAVRSDAVNGRVEISAILQRIHAVSPIRATPAGTWLDAGNADMQARAHRVLLETRAFNEIRIDPLLGTLRKRSRNSQKFIDEINYLRLLPPDLTVLFPRVLGWSTEWAEPWVDMEYYGYPSLSEVFLFENVDPAVWKRVFIHLHEIITTKLATREHPLPAGAVKTMYLDKTRQRVETLQCAPELSLLIAHPGPIIVNGVALANLSTLWPRLEHEVARLETTARGAIVHGDLCLSNILYDLRSRICKFIDPRGSFGSTGVIGDPRYDVAKLWHSVHGLYDFIVNDLFHVKIDGINVELSIRATAAHQQIEQRFAEVFFGQQFEERDVLLISALLFASMPALHYDKPQRQLAMYVRALQLFDEALRLS